MRSHSCEWCRSFAYLIDASANDAVFVALRVGSLITPVIQGAFAFAVVTQSSAALAASCNAAIASFTPPIIGYETLIRCNSDGCCFTALQETWSFKPFLCPNSAAVHGCCPLLRGIWLHCPGVHDCADDGSHALRAAAGNPKFAFL